MKTRLSNFWYWLTHGYSISRAWKLSKNTISRKFLKADYE